MNDSVSPHLHQHYLYFKKLNWEVSQCILKQKTKPDIFGFLIQPPPMNYFCNPRQKESNLKLFQSLDLIPIYEKNWDKREHAKWWYKHAISTAAPWHLWGIGFRNPTDIDIEPKDTKGLLYNRKCEKFHKINNPVPLTNKLQERKMKGSSIHRLKKPCQLIAWYRPYSNLDP